MAKERKSFTLPSTKPIQKAYRIREALEAVKHHDDYNKEFGDLSDLYRVHARRGMVELVWVGLKHPKLASELTQGEITSVLPERGAKRMAAMIETAPPSSIRLENIMDILHVVGAAIKLKDETDELYFPDANLPDNDKLKLYEWCRASIVNWKYIDHEGAGLTLTKKEVDEFILWEPTEELDDA